MRKFEIQWTEPPAQALQDERTAVDVDAFTAAGAVWRAMRQVRMTHPEAKIAAFSVSHVDGDLLGAEVLRTWRVFCQVRSSMPPPTEHSAWYDAHDVLGAVRQWYDGYRDTSKITSVTEVLA